jgi:hypothetical protein
MGRNDRVLVIALAIGAASGLFVWAIIAGAFAKPNDAGWIYHYQTLIGAIFALVAAGIGVWFLQAQIRQTSEIERKRRDQKRAALRAVGPLALATIIEYAKTSASPLRELHGKCRGEHGVLPREGVIRPGIPATPSEAITLLCDFIEYSEPGEAKLIVQLMNEIQIQSARLRDTDSSIGRDDKMITKGNIENYLIDTASIYAIASAGLDFFRERTGRNVVRFRWKILPLSLAICRVLRTALELERVNKLDRLVVRSVSA